MFLSLLLATTTPQYTNMEEHVNLTLKQHGFLGIRGFAESGEKSRQYPQEFWEQFVAQRHNYYRGYQFIFSPIVPNGSNITMSLLFFNKSASEIMEKLSALTPSTEAFKRSLFVVDPEKIQGAGYRTIARLLTWNPVSVPWLNDYMKSNPLTPAEDAFLKSTLERHQKGYLVHDLVEALCLVKSYEKANILKQTEIIEIQLLLFPNIAQDCQLAFLSNDGIVEYQHIKLEEHKVFDQTFFSDFKKIQDSYKNDNSRPVGSKSIRGSHWLMNELDAFRSLNPRSLLNQVLKNVLFTQDPLPALTDFMKSNDLLPVEIDLLKKILQRDENGFYINDFIKTACQMYHSVQIQLIDAELRIRHLEIIDVVEPVIIAENDFIEAQKEEEEKSGPSEPQVLLSPVAEKAITPTTPSEEGGSKKNTPSRRHYRPRPI